MVLKREQPTTSADSHTVKMSSMFVHDRVLMIWSLYTPQQQCKGSTAMFPRRAAATRDLSIFSALCRLCQ